MNRRADQAGTIELLARLPYQFVRLAKAEFENAKREITEKLKRGGIGLLAIIVALFFVFFAIGCLVTAAVAGIAVVWPVWLAALVVAFALLLLAAGAILGGVALLKRAVPVPEETIDRVEGDLQTMSEVRFNASAHMPQHGEKGNWR
jgi:hypothetical protein